MHQKKPGLGDRTDRAWFSHLLRHPARKRSGSILTTLSRHEACTIRRTHLCYRLFRSFAWDLTAISAQIGYIAP